MSANVPTLTFVSGTETSANFRFVNNNASVSGVTTKAFYLEYTHKSGLNVSSRIALSVSDSSGDIIVNSLDSSKTYLFELAQTGTESAGVYIKRSSVVTYAPAGAPGAPIISNLVRNTDGGCELFVTPAAANGGTNIKYAFHSQNTTSVDSPPIKHWSLVDPSGSNANVITLANGNLVFPFSDLSNGDVYEFWVNAINSIGECSPNSNTVVVSPTNCPAAVRDLAQTAGDASAIISWKKPLDETTAITTSATPIISYTLVVNNNATKLNVSTQTFVLDASGNYGDLSWNKTDASNALATVYEYKVAGLTNFTDYTITVFASSVNGAGLERSIQVLPFSKDLNVNSSLKAYPGNTLIDVSWNAPSASIFGVKHYVVDIYTVADVVTAKGVTKTLTAVAGQQKTVTYDMSSNGANNGYTTRFTGLTNGQLYKIVVTVVLKNGTNEIVCTVDKDLNGVFSIPFTSASAVTNYGYNPYSTLAILDWNDLSGSDTGGYPIVRYDVSYVDVSGVVQNLSTKDSTITITGLKNDISYGVYITPITGPVLTFNGTNVVKSTLITGAQNSSNSFRAVSSNSQNVVANTVNSLSYKNVDAANVRLIWKQPDPVTSGGAQTSSSSVVQYNIYRTNSQGFIDFSGYSPISYDASWNSLTDISSNVTVPARSSGYLGVITTVLYRYTSQAGDASFNITSNIQYIPYSTGSAPAFSLAAGNIVNTNVPKSSTNPKAYTKGIVTINITNNNDIPSNVTCFAPDVDGSSLTGAIQRADGSPTADSIIVTSADGLTSTVVFVYNYAITILLVHASNKYGSTGDAFP